MSNEERRKEGMQSWKQGVEGEVWKESKKQIVVYSLQRKPALWTP